ncbi:MAG: hypothetical protein OER96_12545 [Gammaproteobacteria bacterium]|nr:hypothetical protein [Gammaproteobacteria bacterium]
MTSATISTLPENRIRHAVDLAFWFAVTFCGNALAHGTFVSTRPAVFIAAIEGQWVGRAEVTPIGPRPYNITFRRTSQGRVEGSTNPGRSATHYWAFYEENGDLRISFLTTFAGNRDPIFLDAKDWDDNGVLFRAKEPRLLSVRVLSTPDRLLIDVYHWDRPHVSIRLKRYLTDGS